MTKLERLLELLTAERDRRQRANDTDSGVRERFLDQLREIGERLRMGGNEPTPAEQAQSAQELDRWLREWQQGRNRS